MADLRYEPFAAGVTDHLEERRLAAIEQKADAELAAGPGYEPGAELEQLVGDHPTRERMVALPCRPFTVPAGHRTPLAAMQACRRHLALELGLQPGPELCQLEQRILDHDEAFGPRPGLPRPALASGPLAPGCTGCRACPGRRAWRWAVAALIVIALVLVATLLSVPGRRASLQWLTPTCWSPSPARPGHATERIQLSDQPGAFATSRRCRLGRQPQRRCPARGRPGTGSGGRPHPARGLTGELGERRRRSVGLQYPGRHSREDRPRHRHGRLYNSTGQDGLRGHGLRGRWPLGGGLE